jgi:hypothetical protein
MNPRKTSDENELLSADYTDFADQAQAFNDTAEVFESVESAKSADRVRAQESDRCDAGKSLTSRGIGE